MAVTNELLCTLIRIFKGSNKIYFHILLSLKNQFFGSLISSKIIFYKLVMYMKHKKAILFYLL